MKSTGWIVGKLVRAQEEVDRAADEVIGANLQLRLVSKDDADYEGSDLEKAIRASHERLIAETRHLDGLIRDTAALIPTPQPADHQEGEHRG